MLTSNYFPASKVYQVFVFANQMPRTLKPTALAVIVCNLLILFTKAFFNPCHCIVHFFTQALYPDLRGEDTKSRDIN